MIYVVGHKSPDLDSIAAAISYSEFRNKLSGEQQHFPARAGEINKETAYALETFGFNKPILLENASDKQVLLVDHNEFSQSVDGIDKAEIIGVLDHHKIDFQYESPLIFVSLPWGAACSIVAQGFFDRDMAPGKNLAGLMLSAILVDTVITKSPTCTKHDKRIITRLADIAGIKDWKKFGMELFKIRSNVNKSSAVDIIKGDFKDFQTNIGKVGIGQVETVDLNEFKDREDELLQKLQEIKESEDYHTVILFITDIMQEGSQFLVATSDQEKVKEALGSELEDNKVYLPGVISRKKQVAPNFTSVFNK
jgi:manganese-dependent inorganic pyrophosphatase